MKLRDLLNVLVCFSHEEEDFSYDIDCVRTVIVHVKYADIFIVNMSDEELASSGLGDTTVVSVWFSDNADEVRTLHIKVSGVFQVNT